MPRTVPITTLDAIGNFDLRPENAVGLYIESKQQEKNFIKPPNWDSAGDSIEQLAVQNDRENQAMMKLQEEMIENEKHQKKLNAMRIDELHKMQANLKRRFIEVNSFIKDCDDKKVKAEKIVNEEKSKHDKYRQGIEHYKNGVIELEKFSENIKRRVEEFEPYEKVIEEVMAMLPDVYPTLKECMDRCDALMIAQTEISAMQQVKLDEIEALHKKITEVTNKVALTVLGLKNDLAHLERAYNIARAECMKWERVIATAKDCISDRHLEHTRVLDGIRHMFLLVCKRLDIEPPLTRQEYEKQMDFVKEEIEVMRAVIGNK